MRFILFLLGGAVALCCSCTKEPECKSYGAVPVWKVEGPSTGKVGQDIDFNVFYFPQNTCGKFNGFDVVSGTDVRQITVNVAFDGCFCSIDTVARQVQYRFNTNLAGKYYLKFNQGNKFLTDTLVIQ